ncbi:hypothetical protein SAMN05216339_11012 [Nitrosomonas eutropha]|uniref:Uncharacterized protein n=1 Tax=Nitrosomonas eutropha TaxID=916 RepID=A0A1I7IPJ2_9PROT|nr:hypothetical protein SAMN05216339_11012 [Nitrosomonas eutropha]
MLILNIASWVIVWFFYERDEDEFYTILAWPASELYS